MESKDFYDYFNEGQKYERMRVRRDIHDGLAQELLGIRMRLNSLDDTGESLKLRNELEQIQLQIVAAIESLNGIVKDEMTPKLLGSPLENVLTSLLPTIGGIPVIIEGSSGLVFKKDGVCLHIKRIAQEFVRNAQKYSGAFEIKIQLTKKDDHVEISLSDNGKGFQLTETSLGNGIVNIKYRLDRINADYTFESTVGKGTNLIFKIYEKGD